jgi:hypothetical protein
MVRKRVAVRKTASRKKVGLEPMRAPASNRKMAIALSLGIAIIAAIATIAACFWFYDVQVTKYDMHLTVASNLGFNVGTEAVWFGKVPPGASADRTITLNNKNGEARLASLYFFGDLAKWVSIDVGATRIVLAPDESRPIKLTASVPEDAPFGVLDGWVVVVFRKP